ncbi:hypothetical protein AKJ09_01145 [Labilithrix luteola]|uniref:Uncharacterized protein n=1 Tax=Labilithrix luteola TaxID=1391654 RepID=A0A0K1PM56_9BACT|nr:hypothetical protein AKJ09_01145 [Labilithrix luteola]
MLSAGLAGFASLGACTTDYQKGVDDPNYGDPNALAGLTQPGTSENKAAEAGASSGPLCVANGGRLVDAGTCAVSFANEILPAFAAANCALVGGCHGGVTPANQPPIDTANAKATWDAFASLQINNGASGTLTYINPCSTDDKQSGMACNMYATGYCGVHMPSGGQLDQAVITKIETWLKCGSPNN